ncbi:GNAT family N-acetyltransferase [Cellulomonas chengniuliangii]|uniref:GNAT family N-acetyltransferase n=1 Tax=Cellulomonas chengniuliangii TaxID=2968084 RepID=A0ABY5L446_9CELL|nr:GNAT family N-acetyltransferase [Cellulomonas chengniuliangii]MCC2308236.1 GNAT family N-acetyltransferase [Cellulomonas chengniuliangii]MCC2317243.1 GNAT family N-acetyltransferase [Cellulomonas chengniuliangii]UUI76623.1 GNAT family N-acetyltransferase [Cellulomonas chengniuliangii]
MRPAEPADIPALVELCLAARSESTMGAQLCSDDGERLRDQLGALLASRGGQLLVALLDGEPVGLLLGQLVGPGPFTDLVSLNLEAIYVAPRARRRGLGHALMAGALEVAEAGGATEVYAAPLPGARGMQRFFVRLGFAPAAAHRVVSTSALQRRLVAETAGAQSRRGAGRGIEDLIARRRQVRAASRDAGVARTAQAAAGQRSRAAITMQVNRAVQTRRDSESSTTIS